MRHPTAHILRGETTYKTINVMRHVAMTCFQQHLAEPLVFASHLLCQFEEICGAAGDGFVVELPEHVFDSLFWRRVIFEERIAKDVLLRDRR